MSFRKTSLFAFLMTAPLLYAQPGVSNHTPIWFTITPESATISVTLPAGTTYRFGDAVNNRWTQVTVNVDTTISSVSMANGNPFPFSDPDQGTVKELDVLETPAHQLISVTDFAASPATTVSQVVPPLAPPTSVPTLPGTAYTLTFSNFSIAPGTPQNALMLAFVNSPAAGGNRTWEGTNVNLTIDGVTLACTYSQHYTDQVFSLNCTVPPTP